MNSNQENISNTTISKYWVIYYAPHNFSAIHLEIDNLFSNYSFYPEIEWDEYGMRPPENHQVLGAWRFLTSRNNLVFGFLLDNPSMPSLYKDTSLQLVLYIIGESIEIELLNPKIQSLKKRFTHEDRKEKLKEINDKRLIQISNTKFPVLPTVLGIFTLFLNALSIYIRKLPPPQNCGDSFIKIYYFAIGIVHLSAIILLIVVILICLVILFKYAFLLLKRL